MQTAIQRCAGIRLDSQLQVNEKCPMSKLNIMYFLLFVGICKHSRSHTQNGIEGIGKGVLIIKERCHK